MVHYARQNGFNVTKYESADTDSNDGTRWAVLEVSNTLTSTQKTTIRDLFQGTAFIEFT